ncbi:cysteine hydrolase family protein [Sphingomonas faeni]|uniref:cysteine hydrolase family protein n=1 Tax=Sphingomonas faeni TaxID=185950 RepID=UPI0033548561
MSASADTTALLLLDPYNDFMSEGGELYGWLKDVADAVDCWGNQRKVLAAVRAVGIQVFVVPHHRWREGDCANWKAMNPSQIISDDMQVFAAGTWGGEWHPELAPKPGDVVITEHWSQSSFANTDLDAQLKQHGIQKIGSSA